MKAGGVLMRSFRFPILLGSVVHGTADEDTTGRLRIKDTVCGSSSTLRRNCNFVGFHGLDDKLWPVFQTVKVLQ